MRERENASRSSLSVASLHYVMSDSSHSVRTCLSLVKYPHSQRCCIHTTYMSQDHPALLSSLGSQVASDLGWGAGSCPPPAPSILPSFLPSSLPPSTEGRKSVAARIFGIFTPKPDGGDAEGEEEAVWRREREEREKVDTTQFSDYLELEGSFQH